MIILIGQKFIVRNQNTTTTNSITNNTTKNSNILPKISLNIAPSYIIYGR